MLAVTLACGAGLAAGASIDALTPKLTGPSPLPPHGVSGVVHDQRETWTFGVLGLCLQTPGRVVVESVTLNDAVGIELVRLGVRQADADLGIGGLQEPMTDYGYRTAPPLAITSTCSLEPDARPWSLALEVRATTPELDGVAPDISIAYFGDDPGSRQTLDLPMTIQLCRPHSTKNHCQH